LKSASDGAYAADPAEATEAETSTSGALSLVEEWTDRLNEWHDKRAACAMHVPRRDEEHPC